MQKCIKKLSAIVFLCIGCIPYVCHAGRSIEIVDLRLPWKHQFQFAGYYAALEKGYYAKAGLNVIIHEGTPSSVMPQVLAGQAQYGVGHSELLYARLQGSPIVALAAIFQHSPSVLLTNKNILTPHDLIGKRVMISNKDNIAANGDTEFFDMFDKQAINVNQLELLQSHFDINDLINGKTDALQAYITNEVYSLQQKGYPFNIIDPRNYGVNFYSNVLFTTEEEVNAHSDRVKAFRQASLDGWRYALEHQDEMIDLLHSQYHVGKTSEELRFEANMMERLIDRNMIELGHLTLSRWHNMSITFAKLNLLHTDLIFDRLLGFNFDSEKFLQKKLDINLFYGLLAGFVSFLIISILLYISYVRQLSENIQKNKIISLNAQLSHLQRMESIGRLTAGIAHDFNNLLMAISGFNELIKFSADDLLLENVSRAQINAELVENSEQIQTASGKAASLIEKMLLYCRRDGDNEVHNPVLDLNSVLEENLKMLRSTIPSTITFETDLVDQTFDLSNLDEMYLNQIIVNLYVNARDALSGKGKITLKTGIVKNVKNLCSCCQSEVVGQFVEISVKDNGSGIKPDIAKRIFEPFYTTKPVGEGTGLGLSVIVGILHNAGGHILLESEVGIGTTFRLLLPQN
jgi:signal transduction histidine kinase